MGLRNGEGHAVQSLLAAAVAAGKYTSLQLVSVSCCNNLLLLLLLLLLVY
jgi:hypothetical protein